MEIFISTEIKMNRVQRQIQFIVTFRGTTGKKRTKIRVPKMRRNMFGSKIDAGSFKKKKERRTEA